MVPGTGDVTAFFTLSRAYVNLLFQINISIQSDQLSYLIQGCHLAQVRLQQRVEKGGFANIGAADKVDVSRQGVIIVLPVVKDDLDQFFNIQTSAGRDTAGRNDLRESTILAFSIPIHVALLHEIPEEQCIDLSLIHI